MADKTIHELDVLSSPASDDEIGIWDLTAGQYMRITRATFIGGTITGGGTLATGNFTLTVPATGTAALLGVANTFTAMPTFQGAAQDAVQTLARFSGNNAAAQLKALDIKLTAGTPDVLLTTAASGTDASLSLSSGGATPAISIRNNGAVGIGKAGADYPLDVLGNAFFSADVSALTFTDRTEFFKGNALAELAGVKSEEGSDMLDHASLPTFARHENGGRDLGGMISLLTVAVQQLVARIEALEAGSGKLP